MTKQYQPFVLAQDLNPVIKKGMIGVVLEVLDEDVFEVEFVKEDGRNFEYDGKCTFTINSSYFESNFIKSKTIVIQQYAHNLI